MQRHIYFQSRCIDDIVLEALIWDYLEAKHGWAEFELHPVN